MDKNIIELEDHFQHNSWYMTLQKKTTNTGLLK